MNATTNSVFFSGETEARAVLAAANHFGVPPNQVVFDRVEKRHGFVKRRRVVIRVDPEQVGSGAGEEAEVETRQETAVEESPAGPAPSAPEDATPSLEEETPSLEEETPGLEEEAPGLEEETPGLEEETPGLEEETPGLEEEAPGLEEEAPVEVSATDEGSDQPDPDAEEILEIARSAFRQLLELADLEVSADMVLADGRLEVEIEGVDQELLVEDEGQVLLALQHLLPRVMYGRLGRIVPCHLDSGGYQQRKEERLRGLARRVAEEVVSRGGTRTLRPMNPADRRIVHITLADDPDVETESHGNGYFKRVNISSV